MLRLTDREVANEVQRIRASASYENSDIDVAKRAHLLAATGRAATPGIWAEFGVGMGRTLATIARSTEAIVYGFDWFRGLPEEWVVGGERGSFPEGSFADTPSDLPDNVRLIVGLFQDTVAPFFSENVKPISFAHIDCDLYSSTAIVMHAIAARLVPGTVLVFDELFNYPRQGDHEMLALIESSRQYGFEYAYIGHVPERAQASLVITRCAS